MEYSVTLTDFGEPKQSFEAKRIIDHVEHFDPSDMQERIRRAHCYSAKCERLRDEHTVKIIERMADIGILIAIASVVIRYLIGG